MKTRLLTRLTCYTLLCAELATAFSPRTSHPRRPTAGPRAAASLSQLSAALSAGDTVLVVGGTGGVGQLVTRKLRAREEGCSVRVTSRDQARGEETVDDAAVQVVTLDLVAGRAAELAAALSGVAAVVIAVGTTAFPTMKWKDGNTPQAIDEVAVTKLVQAATAVPTVQKIVLVTSVGVERTDEMPFKILNLFGVLDAKRAGEDALREAATKAAVDYVVVRPGRLIGGPFTNLDVAKLMQIEGGAENGVDVVAGDSLLGDCKRDACAEAIVQALFQEAAQNIEFSLASNENKALTEAEWTTRFQSLAK
jgi:nucleoside-diphosphate-sugar epimerase